MNVDPDAVLSVSMLDADAKVLIEMQEEDLRHRNSPGQAIQMSSASIQPLKTKAPYSVKLTSFSHRTTISLQICFEFGLGYD